jgi:hypothetical protein
VKCGLPQRNAARCWKCLPRARLRPCSAHADAARRAGGSSPASGPMDRGPGAAGAVHVVARRGPWGCVLLPPVTVHEASMCRVLPRPHTCWSYPTGYRECQGHRVLLRSCPVCTMFFDLFSQISRHSTIFFSHNKPANSTFS